MPSINIFKLEEEPLMLLCGRRVGRIRSTVDRIDRSVSLLMTFKLNQ